MSKSLQDWLKEGMELYNTAMTEYRELEEQLAALQEQLTSKRTEVNQIAKMIGKPTLDRITPMKGEKEAVEPTVNGTAPAEPVEVAVEVVDPGQAAPYTLSSIAKALTGKPTRR